MLKQTVLIFTVGKVGSSSIYSTCLANENIDAYHLHHISPQALQAQSAAFVNNPEMMHDHLKTALLLAERKALQNENLKVINLVRDPVSRSLSHFFQDYFAPSSMNLKNLLQQIDEFGEEKMATEIIKMFLAKSRHLEPFNWVKTELSYILQDEPYKHPFNKDDGYNIIENKNVSLLTLQCEIDDKQKLNAVSEFLDLSFDDIVTSNITGDRNVGNIYKKVKSLMKLPTEYLDMMYKNEYCEHYYSQKQLAAFREVWSNNSFWHILTRRFR